MMLTCGFFLSMVIFITLDSQIRLELMHNECQGELKKHWWYFSKILSQSLYKKCNVNQFWSKVCTLAQSFPYSDPSFTIPSFTSHSNWSHQLSAHAKHFCLSSVVFLYPLVQKALEEQPTILDYWNIWLQHMKTLRLVVKFSLTKRRRKDLQATYVLLHQSLCNAYTSEYVSIKSHYSLHTGEDSK